MAAAFVTSADALTRLAAFAGRAPDSNELLAEIVRSEVHARQRAPRATTLSRVATMLAPAMEVDAQRLGEVCDDLEREGDLVLATGGVLYATPTRAVPVTRGARVFGSLPTRALAATLDREVSAVGATRAVATTDGLADALAKVGGALVAPEVWTGLDRAAPADAAFGAALDRRLEWEPTSAGSLERDGALEWRTWEVTGDAPRWRRSAEGRLWWARTRFGGHQRAWTAGASPAASPFVELSADDADRARFALSRESEAPMLLTIERTGETTFVDVPGWLPRSEYRWLSLHGEPVTGSTGRRWAIPAAAEGTITQLLADRLGLVVEVR